MLNRRSFLLNPRLRTGHMLRLCSWEPSLGRFGPAGLQMDESQRAAVTVILKKHPHYAECLVKEKPDGFTVDEWVFMRAGMGGLGTCGHRYQTDRPNR